MFYRILIFVMFLLSVLNTYSTEKIINILYPAGGEELFIDSPLTISWECSNDIDSLDILLWDGTTSSWIVIADVRVASSSSFTFNLNEQMLTSKGIFYIFDKNRDFNNFTLLPSFVTISQSSQQSGTSVSEFGKGLINVFPNPSDSKLYINITDNDFKLNNVKIINIAGEILKEFKELKFDSINELEIGDVPNGPYLLILTDILGNSHTHKIIINH